MKVVRELLSSKKFIAAMVGVVVWIGGYVGLDLSVEEVGPAVGIIVTFILAQGWADQGKEAAKIQANSPKPPVDGAS